MMSDYDLDRAERAVLRAFEDGKFRTVRGIRTAKKRYRTFAQWTLSKPRSINIRIAERDLQRLKAMAAELGLPYQTFISALLHQHSSKPVRSTRPSRKSVV